jgi:RimJ/RimL family protein N-acetyltransferase
MARAISEAARAAFAATGCRDYARIDFRIPAGCGADPLIIDVNPNPAIDAGAGFARSARAAGIPYPRLIARIVEMAEARRRGRRPRAPMRPVAGARLRLEPPAPRHLGALSRWFSDPRTGRYMDNPGTLYTEEELAEAFFVGRDDVDFVACDPSTGAPLGYCGLYGIENGRAQVTFLVGEEPARGRGLGREMGELLFRVAFADLGLEALDASVVVENESSLRLCLSLGMREAGRRRGSHRLGDRRLDEVLLELTREEYAAGRP